MHNENLERFFFLNAFLKNFKWVCRSVDAELCLIFFSASATKDESLHC